MRRTVSTVVVAALLGLIAPGGLASADQDTGGFAHRDTPCYGAAARDPQHACQNPSLRLRVFPDPETALMEVSSPCRTTERSEQWSVCVAGADREVGATHVALIGDSHAGHFGPALRVIADDLGIRVSTIWQPGCPFSAIPPALEAKRSADCATWNARVLSWLGDHPEIRTVFLSAHATARVQPRPGRTRFRTRVEGYRSAIDALPDSVEHVVVLRDIPGNPVRTSACVAGALGRGVPAGAACQVRRTVVLPRDAEAEAAAEVTSRNAHVVDLTPFMCGRRFCRPVVGGVLVHKDGDHLTTEFSETLGPYIERAVSRLRPRVPGFGRSSR